MKLHERQKERERERERECVCVCVIEIGTRIITICMYSRVAYIYVRLHAKYLKFRTTTSKINTLRKLLMQQKYYFVHEI